MYQTLSMYGNVFKVCIWDLILSIMSTILCVAWVWILCVVMREPHKRFTW